MGKRLAGVKKTTPVGIEKQTVLLKAGFTLALEPLKVFCFFILGTSNYKDECQIVNYAKISYNSREMQIIFPLI
ncbi:MAG TPA: hypothetical protein VNZ86_07250 [Bacteroidia bacterium]|jgi:hypothetical protein|nr:hypothetical protein [Bacteroidia bacterium]